MASLLSLLETPEPPHMTMRPRPGTLALDEVNSKIDALLGRSEMDRLERELARAAVLLWHDHFDAAHTIVQDIENADASLLHGILHRREPDYMNARYWFRRVGPHRSFECVVGKIKVALLTTNVEVVAKQIAPNDKWHPLSFVDFLEDNAKRNDTAYDHFMRQIQSAEIHCFLQTLPTLQK
jgi:hypothetical protein